MFVFVTKIANRHWAVGKISIKCVSPAFLRMLLSLIVELQRDLSIQADAKVVVHHTLLHVTVSATQRQKSRHGGHRWRGRQRQRNGSHSESRSGSMKGVAPNGSMLARSILLMMELPAIEAASPARKPADKHRHPSVKQQHQATASHWLCVCVWEFTRADDACVEHGEVLLAGGEGGDGEGAIRLGATAHPALCWRTGTLCSWTHTEAERKLFRLRSIEPQSSKLTHATR